MQNENIVSDLVFKQLQLELENQQCFDCGQAQPQWASVNNGIFICMNCAAMHRSMGVQISFVRSLSAQDPLLPLDANLKKWSDLLSLLLGLLMTIPLGWFASNRAKFETLNVSLANYFSMKGAASILALIIFYIIFYFPRFVTWNSFILYAKLFVFFIKLISKRTT